LFEDRIWAIYSYFERRTTVSIICGWSAVSGAQQSYAFEKFNQGSLEA